MRMLALQMASHGLGQVVRWHAPRARAGGAGHHVVHILEETAHDAAPAAHEAVTVVGSHCGSILLTRRKRRWTVSWSRDPLFAVFPKQMWMFVLQRASHDLRRLVVGRPALRPRAEGAGHHTVHLLDETSQDAAPAATDGLDDVNFRRDILCRLEDDGGFIHLRRRWKARCEGGEVAPDQLVQF